MLIRQSTVACMNKPASLRYIIIYTAAVTLYAWNFVLQQRLEMARQAVDDKEQELSDVRKALGDANEDAATMDLQRERKSWNERDRSSKGK